MAYGFFRSSRAWRFFLSFCSGVLISIIPKTPTHTYCKAYDSNYWAKWSTKRNDACPKDEWGREFIFFAFSFITQCVV